MALLESDALSVLENLIKLFEFSEKKKLFPYQKKAVDSAINALLSYLEDKDQVYEFYKAKNNSKDISLKLSASAKKILREAGFQVKGDRLLLKEIVNRTSIWMATGSGKTLVIIKLIEALKALMSRRLIPEADILFLTSRDDLVDQFIRHLEEFNQSRDEKIKIYAYNLKDYEAVKTNRELFTNQDGIDVFYYRSDLLSDENKEKILDYRKFPTNWYLILDEAHKGDKTDSKRQAIFTALSKDGFMFNFSATFTDQIDHITCAYSFNLRDFISEGYGKKICLLKYDTRALTSSNNRSSKKKGKKKEQNADEKQNVNIEFSEEEKQKVLLKTLILLTLVKKARKKLDFYHHPMMLVLGNSVNTEDSDLEMFFRELSKVALGQVSEEVFRTALEELREDLSNFKYAFENNKETTLVVDHLTIKDVLSEVFNTESFGKIEIIKIPNNTQELVFKHVGSSQPFMLLKIGDISEWLTNKLEGYQITTTFDKESIFRKLNESEYSSINILLGSRAFYEGWDSNRPNVILYLNIGTQEAKKFILQSMGRGVRIEVKGERKRLEYVDPKAYNENKQYVDYLETLFVLGTRIDDIQKIVETLKTQDEEGMEDISHLFEVNQLTKQVPLFVPVYEEVGFIAARNRRLEISEKDFELLKLYCEYLGKKILLVKYNLPVKVLKLLFESLEDPKRFYIFGGREIKDAEIVLMRVVNWFTSNTFYEFRGFEDEGRSERQRIVHFKRIRVRKDKVERLKQIIANTRALVEPSEYVLDKNLKLKAYQLCNHYYLPIVLSEEEKAEFITHIIKTPSEVAFIEKLIEYLGRRNNLFSKFDWWMFSKIDESLDEVFIPYTEDGRTRQFKPDFIFWCAKGNDYYIIFLDPKSTEYTAAFRKIDGYKEVYMDMEKREPKSFVHEGKTIRVFLFMFGNVDRAGKEYRDFWISSLSDMREYLDLYMS